MVKIIDIEPGSIADELGLQVGDAVMKINEKEINDRLDYRFYMSADEVELMVQQSDGQTVFEIEKDPDDQLGITLADMKLKACGNNCVFCFVYQNPEGLRKPLYFKDEDYRYSFLYGHYVTMTTLRQKELERIIEQRMSPLYISVHATEEKTRKLLLGIKFEDHLLEKISYLTSNGIELHAQIVLCPEINDGDIFRKTVDDLKKFFPRVRSVAVVPLGLTRHRQNLMELRMHTEEELTRAIEEINDLRAKLREELGDAFVYLADEFFIKAGVDIPDATYYDEFYQIENGVGEFRDMIDSFNEAIGQLPKSLDTAVRVSWVTGQLAAPLLDRFILDRFRKIERLEIDLLPVRNDFYGTTIQISGLLVGQDIYSQLKGKDLGDIVLLPPRVLNEDGLLLDNWTVEQLEQKLERPVYVYTDALAELPRVLREQLKGTNPKNL